MFEPIPNSVPAIASYMSMDIIKGSPIDWLFGALNTVTDTYESAIQVFNAFENRYNQLYQYQIAYDYLSPMSGCCAQVLVAKLALTITQFDTYALTGSSINIAKGHYLNLLSN